MFKDVEVISEYIDPMQASMDYMVFAHMVHSIDTCSLDIIVGLDDKTAASGKFPIAGPWCLGGFHQQLAVFQRTLLFQRRSAAQV